MVSHTFFVVVVGVFIAGLRLSRAAVNPVLLNQFELPYAGFSTLLRTWTLNSTSWSLLISAFNPIPTTKDFVYTVPNIQWQLTTPIKPEVLTDAIVWPNGPVAADWLVPYAVIIPSGFLVPGKSNGNLYFISTAGPPMAMVPTEKTNWFYHDAAFKDVDGDGHFDIVAGRANVPILGQPTSQLIWLKNPGNLTITGPWELFPLMKQSGPDIQVQFANIDSKDVLFGNSYFSRKLQMLWSDSDRFWNDTTKLHVRHVDYENLPYFGVQLTSDLNGDQRPDLLVTVNDENNGSLVVYELPPSGQILSGPFVKHVLANGFAPRVHAKGRGAPGQAVAVQLYTLNGRIKPIIILSGDDDGCLYLFEALHDTDPANWEYSKKIIYQAQKSTIGQPSIEDIDGDGHPEMFVPIYNEGRVLIYRLLSTD